MEYTIDEQRARSLVELIFDRFTTDRNLDDDVEIIGWVLAHGDEFDVHGARR
jgi:hypothetical protein